MKYKILELSWVTLLCFLCAALAAGSNSKLEIFRNVNGSVVEVPSKLQVPSGANLTLICKVENIKNKGLVNGNVTWFIPLKLHSRWKLKGLKNGSNLVFSNVNGNNEGLYVCGNLKFKIFKILHLLVEHNKSAKPSNINVSRLAKREIVPGYGPAYDFNITDFDIRDFDQFNADIDKMSEDFLREFKEYNNGLSLDNINHHHHPYSHPFPVKPVAAIFGTLLIILLICLLIRLCGYINQNSSTNRNNPQLNAQHIAVITSPRVNRYRNDTSPTAPVMIFDPMDLERLRAPHMGNLTTQLDLPPTYSSSVHNSTQNLTNDTTHGLNKKIVNTADSNNSNLPPSYCEAVGHKDHSYNGVASHNHSGQHHRGDYGHDHHNATNGFSGNHSSGGDGGGHSGSHGGGDSGGHGGGDSGGGCDSGGGGNND